MKILALRLSQLASLPGPVELDFTAAPLADAGLFAITGPTGAGKSTLLDALCLALFGNTPRLRHAPGRDSHLDDLDGSRIATADPRSLLRRGAASGYAEVDFIGRDARRYRARWAVRRARDKADGKLQAVEQSLTDLDDERLLTAQKREFAELIPERLGLSFEQFTRAVLLAQSEFAAFLKADDNARSDLLEKLTNTQEYSRISVESYARAKEARDAVARQQALLAEDAPSDDTARQAMEQELAEAEGELDTCQRQMKALDEEAQWLAQDAQWRQRCEQADASLVEAEARWEALSDQRRECEMLERVAPWRPQLLRQRSLSRQLPDQRQQLELATSALAQARTALEQQHQQTSRRRQTLEDSEQALEQARPAIAQAREIASELKGREQQHRQLEDEHHQRKRQREDLDGQQRALAERHRRHLEQRDAATRTLSRHLGQHQQVATARAEAQQHLEDAGHRLLALSELEQRWRLLRQLDEQQRRLDAERRRDSAQRDELLDQGKQARARLDHASAEHEQLTRFIQRARATRSDSVADMRATLEPDTACPVCGSHDHPWRDSPPATPEATQLAAQIALEDDQLAESESRLGELREQRDALFGRFQALKASVEQAETSLLALEPRRNEAQAGLEEAQARLDDPALAEQWRALDAEARQAWLTEHSEKARQRQQQARERLQALDDAERQLAPLAEAIEEDERERQALTLRATTFDEELKRLDDQRPELTRSIDEHRRRLAEALGDDRSADAWLERLEAQVRQARQDHEQARQAHDQAQRQVLSLTQRIEHEGKALSVLEDEKTRLDAELERWRSEHPDITDGDLERLLDQADDALKALRARLDGAREACQTARTSRDERRQGWRAWRARHLPEQDPQTLLDEATQRQLDARQADLDARREANRPRLEAAQQRRDGALHAVRDDDRRRQRQRDGLEALERARAEHHRWGRIAELIGAADGKTFRRIAQAWNLERLIDEANVHLAGLSRRYRLVRGGSPLGLLVIDQDVADERRSVHSLSGGETFLVSLAMALGLASLASGELAIESLFIDEGFGSLDPQSLALAMDALDGLQAQGRRVGVISHVQEMHERIPVQIQVHPAGNGESRVALSD
ncbi:MULTISPECIES: AAA family ATPase [unclassified Halomonas]|uniref:AAA family ATPase n=1 Tax=unclassified Halomonas TaxID=2609666 RepID=UPI000C8D6C85|nr:MULTISPECIES: AAA family ATPase [unclassified Halomonas]MAR72344.1 chromosome segregation protein SMC [Halomonas sp.]MBR9879851.1 AAA family ATPase [Gammaproteobacteria bacterium]MBS8270445.1 chromosome segregation protein SMC [Halomonas litopenaei]